MSAPGASSALQALLGGTVLSDLTASIAGLAALTALFGAALLLFLLPRARALRSRLQRASMRHWAARTLYLGDRSVDIRIGPRTHRGIPQMIFSTAVARLPALQIRRPGWLDRAGRRCGLSRIARSGDIDFDRRALVSCDYRELAALLFREPATRSAVLALLDAQARLLQFDDGELSAYFDVDGSPEAIEEQLRPRAELLAALARQPKSIIGALTPMTALWPLRRMSLLVGGALLPLLAIGTCAVFLDQYAPLDLQALVLDALKLAPLWCLLALAPALILLRGHPDSARLVPAALLASGIAAAPAAIAFNLARNSADAVAARDATVAVTGSVKLSGPQSPTLRWSSTALQRRGLFGGPHSLSTEVNEVQWQSTPIARARLHARIAPGALGYPWLVSVSATSVANDEPAIDEGASRAVTVAGPALRLSYQLMLPQQRGDDLLALAKVLHDDGKLLPAVRQLDQALAQLEREGAPPQVRAETHRYRAMIYAKLGAPFDAQQEADARAALALVPGHAAATALLGDILIGRRAYDEALQLWDVVLAHQPDYQFGHYKRAQLLAATGALVEARNEALATCRRGERSACDLAESF